MMSRHHDISIFQNDIHTSIIHFRSCCKGAKSHPLFSLLICKSGAGSLPDADVWKDELWPYGSTTATSTGFLAPIAGCTTIATHRNVHHNFPEKQWKSLKLKDHFALCFQAWSMSAKYKDMSHSEVRAESRHSLSAEFTMSWDTPRNINTKLHWNIKGCIRCVSARKALVHVVLAQYI